MLQVQAAKASPLDETLFVCPECKQVPDSLRQLMDHLNDEHYQEDLPPKKLVQCRFCDFISNPQKNEGTLHLGIVFAEKVPKSLTK